MMVVSNTSPLNYLVLIEQIDVLPRLYDRVIIPSSVFEELRAPETPETVQVWIGSHPDWLEISSESGAADPSLDNLHAGERDAILLALSVGADALIMDERAGRNEATKRGIRVIGTIGVLASAHERGLLALANAISRLQQTTFHASPKLLASVLRRYEDSGQ